MTDEFHASDLQVLPPPESGCVTSENEVAVFGRLVTGKTGFVGRLVGRFAIIELGEAPAACRSVSC